MEYVESIRRAFGGPIDFPQVILAVLVLIILIVAEHYYRRDGY